MKYLLILALLALPLQSASMPTEQDYCAAVGLELLLAVEEGYISLSDDHVARIINRCKTLELIDNEETTNANRSV